jgi:hypothetical protein
MAIRQGESESRPNLHSEDQAVPVDIQRGGTDEKDRTEQEGEGGREGEVGRGRTWEQDRKRDRMTYGRPTPRRTGGATVPIKG